MSTARTAHAGLRRRAIPLIFGAVLVLTSALAQRADAFVYWANFGTSGTHGTTLGRANTNGTGANQSFITGLDRPCGVAIDAAHIYWANQGTDSIGRANLNGTGANPTFIDNADVPCGVAVDGAHVYWANGDPTNSIGRASLNGTSPNQSFITGGDGPCGVAVDGAHVYWANNGVDPSEGSVGRADLNGDNPDQDFITGTESPCGVAVNSAHVYWAQLDSPAARIGRADLDGDPSSVNQNFITGLSSACGLAVDAAHIYWGRVGSANAIGRADLDGTLASVNQSFITGAFSPCGVTVNSLSKPSCQSTSASTDHAQPVGITLPCTSGGGTRTFSIVSQPPNGSISGFNTSTGRLTYTPDTGFSGSDSFTYRDANPGASSNTATATIGVGKAPNEFSLGTPVKNKKKGTAKLPINDVPGPGTLDLSGPKVKDAFTGVLEAGDFILPVRAKSKARKKLKKKGKAKVALEVTFSPTGGDPASQDASVKLKRKR